MRHLVFSSSWSKVKQALECDEDEQQKARKLRPIDALPPTVGNKTSGHSFVVGTAN